MSLLTAYDKFIQVALKYGFSLFGLPKTGQTVEYQAGDDGTYEKGYPKTGARFVDNGDGTITDKATGLMWAKDGNGAGCNNGATIAWGAAITFAEGLTFAGYSDWRLPNVKELISIIDYSRNNPALNPIFTNPKSGYYWSSTTGKAFTVFAWYANFIEGNTSVAEKTSTYYVWCVRGGA